jgi:hypothetical protein
MDVLSIVRLLIRHWRVTAPALVLTLIGGVGVFKLSSPSYEATGSVTLLSPPAAPTDAAGQPISSPEVGQNPYARSGDLAVMADILARVLNGESKRADFAKQGVTGYTVVANRFQRGPVIDVTGQGPTAEEAIKSADTVLAQIDAVLADLQEAVDADPGYLITSAPLESPTMASAMYGSTMRAAIAVLALGMLGTLGLAVLAEVGVRRRKVQSAEADAEVGVRRRKVQSAEADAEVVVRRRTMQPAATDTGLLDHDAGSHTAGRAPNQRAEAPGRETPRSAGVIEDVEAAMRDVARRSAPSPSKLRSSWPHATKQPPSVAPTDNGPRRQATDRNA